MSTVTHETMHQDHKRWLSDNDMWRCDISAWQKEFKTAAAELKQIEAAVKEHEKALQVHAAAIRLREQELAGHEHALAEYEQGETVTELIPLAKAHEKEAAKHAQQHDAHERIKQSHHNGNQGHVVARSSQISRSIDEIAPNGPGPYQAADPRRRRDRVASRRARGAGDSRHRPIDFGRADEQVARPRESNPGWLTAFERIVRPHHHGD